MMWTRLSVTASIFAACASAVIVDRIAIAVGDKTITDSEIDRRIRLTAFQNHNKPDFSEAARRASAQQLIDQKLIEREMDVGRYPRLDEEHKHTLLEDFENDDYKGDASALSEALAASHLTLQDLKDDLGRQSDLLTFLNLRFRPAVQVTDQDVQHFLDTVPKGAGGSAEDLRSQIEQKLTADRADRELDLWLQDQRKHTRIDYLEKELESPK
jgi:hypothetical protein